MLSIFYLLFVLYTVSFYNYKPMFITGVGNVLYLYIINLYIIYSILWAQISRHTTTSISYKKCLITMSIIFMILKTKCLVKIFLVKVKNWSHSWPKQLSLTFENKMCVIRFQCTIVWTWYRTSFNLTNSIWNLIFHGGYG